MGSTSYSVFNSSVRSESRRNLTDHEIHTTVFTQTTERKIHDSMIPKNVDRESRFSELHPAVIPVILGLDVTGSMGSLPRYLVKDGLPNLMTALIDKGLDTAVLFTAIGDHIYDSYPFQVGQFESGDEELDMWLTRTLLEGGGGANEGESYLLAWYFAAFHTQTDAWDKNKQKGLLITFGDEPVLNSISASAIKQIFGDSVEKSYTAEELFNLASERYYVYHITIEHSSRGRSSAADWKQKYGENALSVPDAESVSQKIVDITTNLYKVGSNNIVQSQTADTPSSKPASDDMML